MREGDKLIMVFMDSLIMVVVSVSICFKLVGLSGESSLRGPSFIDDTIGGVIIFPRFSLKFRRVGWKRRSGGKILAAALSRPSRYMRKACFRPNRIVLTKSH